MQKYLSLSCDACAILVTGDARAYSTASDFLFGLQWGERALAERIRNGNDFRFWRVSIGDQVAPDLLVRFGQKPRLADLPVDLGRSSGGFSLFRR